MLTLVFFVVFLAGMVFHHYQRKENAKHSTLRRIRLPLILTAILLVPILVANTVPENGRVLSLDEYLEYVDEYGYDFERRMAYELYMKEHPENMEIRFRFIESATDFDFYPDSPESLRTFEFSPIPEVQQQSIAYAEAYLLYEDTIPANPVKGAMYSNYIRGVEREKQGNYFVAKLYYYQEMRDNPDLDRVYNAVLKLCEKHYPDEYNELLHRNRNKEKRSFNDRRYSYFMSGDWFKYFELITIKVFSNIKFMAFFAALMISVIWLVFLRSLDIFNTEKWRDLIIVFLGGAAMTHLCLFGYDIAHHYLHLQVNGEFFNDFLYCAGVIGVSEETVKLIPWITFLALTKKWKEPYDYLLYACVSALGFAFVENFSYLENPGNITLRSIMSTVGHMFDASLVAYGFILGRYKAKTTLMKWLFPVAGFLAACLAHGFYDFWLVSPAVANYFFFTIIFFVLSVHVWFQFINITMNNSPFYVSRAFNPLIQIDLLAIGFVSILATEYLLIYFEFGTLHANERIAFNGWMVPVFLTYVMVLFSEFHPVRGNWKKFRFNWAGALSVVDFFGHFRKSEEIPDFDYRSYDGLELRLFVPKSNRFVGDKFPIRGKCVDLITVSGADNWSLFQVTSDFSYPGFRNDYVILRAKEADEILTTDKVEIILLFLPVGTELDGRNLETGKLRFTGKAFARPV